MGITTGQCPIGPQSNRLHAVCIFNIFHLMFNFKSKVSRDVLKNKNKCQIDIYILFQNDTSILFNTIC